MQLQQSDKQKMWEDGEQGPKIKLPGSLQAQGLGNQISEKTQWMGLLKNTSWLPYSGKQKDGSFKVAGWLQPEKHYVCGSSLKQKRDTQILPTDGTVF